jgi:hypothetical protein
MLSPVDGRTVGAVAACLLAMIVAGCGSGPKRVQAPAHRSTASALMPMRLCFRRHGYSVAPEQPSDLRTAPRRFEFVAVWNLLNPDGIAVAVAVSSSVEGATRAAAWTRNENTKLGRGVVVAPVVQFGKIDVLWTAKPGRRDVQGIYGCVRPSS